MLAAGFSVTLQSSIHLPSSMVSVKDYNPVSIQKVLPMWVIKLLHQALQLGLETLQVYAIILVAVSN